MAGQLKVGGNITASHSGVEGAGEVTLQNATLDSGVTFPAGHVIKTHYKHITDAYDISMNSDGSFKDVTDLFIDITTIASNSIFLFQFQGAWGRPTGNYHYTMRLARLINNLNETYPVRSDPDGNRTSLGTGGFLPQSSAADNTEGYSQFIQIIDTPTYNVGDVLRYKLQATVNTTNGVIYINRTNYHRDGGSNPYDPMGTSSFVVMEIAQ